MSIASDQKFRFLLFSSLHFLWRYISSFLFYRPKRICGTFKHVLFSVGTQNIFWSPSLQYICSTLFPFLLSFSHGFMFFMMSLEWQCWIFGFVTRGVWALKSGFYDNKNISTLMHLRPVVQGNHTRLLYNLPALVFFLMSPEVLSWQIHGKNTNLKALLGHPAYRFVLLS